MPTEQDKQIADLTKRAERAEKLAKMSDAQRAHLATLSGDDAEGFVSKKASERDAILAELEKANEVIYTSTTDGAVYRKNDDRRLIEMAKRQDAQGVELAKAKARTEQVELEKRAGVELSHFAKGLPVHTAILKAIDGIADEAVRKEALEALKGANAAMKDLGKPRGSTETGDAAPVDKREAYAALEKGLVAFAKEHKIEKVWTDGLDAFVQTPTGAALYSAHQALTTPPSN